MRRCGFIALTIGASVCCAPSFAMPLSEMKVIGQNGSWELRRGVDSFTDKVSCVINTIGDFSVQSTSRTIYIKPKGISGLEGYQIRLDDGAPTNLKLASSIEKQISSAIFEGNDFSAIANSKRFRIQLMGYSSSSNADLNMTGFLLMLSEWNRASCPK